MPVKFKDALFARPPQLVAPVFKHSNSPATRAAKKSPAWTIASCAYNPPLVLSATMNTTSTLTTSVSRQVHPPLTAPAFKGALNVKISWIPKDKLTVLNVKNVLLDSSQVPTPKHVSHKTAIPLIARYVWPLPPKISIPCVRCVSRAITWTPTSNVLPTALKSQLSPVMSITASSVISTMNVLSVPSDGVPQEPFVRQPSTVAQPTVPDALLLTIAPPVMNHTPWI